LKELKHTEERGKKGDDRTKMKSRKVSSLGTGGSWELEAGKITSS
jgi:hypothetical protein